MKPIRNSSWLEEEGVPLGRSWAGVCTVVGVMA